MADFKPFLFQEITEGMQNNFNNFFKKAFCISVKLEF